MPQTHLSSELGRKVRLFFLFNCRCGSRRRGEGTPSPAKEDGATALASAINGSRQETQGCPGASLPPIYHKIRFFHPGLRPRDGLVRLGNRSKVPLTDDVTVSSKECSCVYALSKTLSKHHKNVPVFQHLNTKNGHHPQLVLSVHKHMITEVCCTVVG